MNRLREANRLAVHECCTKYLNCKNCPLHYEGSNIVYNICVDPVQHPDIAISVFKELGVWLEDVPSMTNEEYMSILEELHE